MNITKHVAELNRVYGEYVKVRFYAPTREIQVRFASSPDYSGDDVAFFDIGHTPADKVTACEDAEQVCRDYRRIVCSDYESKAMDAIVNAAALVDVIVTVKDSTMRQVYHRVSDAQATQIMMKYAPMSGYTVTVKASEF